LTVAEPSDVLAADRTRFSAIIAELDGAERNKERCHRRKRDYRSLDELDVPLKNTRGCYKPGISASLYSKQACAEDILFSEYSENIHELVSDGTLSVIIRGLTTKQKEVLHLVAVQRYSIPEATEKLGVSARNVHKLYYTALYHIRGKFYPVIKLKGKLAHSDMFRGMVLSRGICTTKAERKFLETADKDAKSYYGEMTGK
jgi:hypothetical protein